MLSLVKRFKEINDHAIKKGTPPATLIIDCPCPDSEVHKHGIIETDSAMRVTSFLEKPSVDQTASRKQCPAFYLIHSQHLGKIKEFLDSKRDQPLASRDATGNLLRYLIEQKSPVYSMSVSKRFDVGGLATYIQCSREFEELKNDK